MFKRFSMPTPKFGKGSAREGRSRSLVQGKLLGSSGASPRRVLRNPKDQPNMIIPSLSEVAIILVSFGIVGTYLLIVRQFLKNSERPCGDPRKEGSH
jgi:hypothetical protein